MDKNPFHEDNYVFSEEPVKKEKEFYDVVLWIAIMVVGILLVTT